MTVSTLWIALTLGVFSTLHCWGMCGGIVTALSFGVPADIRRQRIPFCVIITAYNMGRITTYTVFGLIAGYLGDRFTRTPVFIESGQQVLQGLASIVLMLIGLNMVVRLSWAQRIEAIGYRLWSCIRPVGRFLLPVNNPLRAFAMGSIWGLLPCALVYSVLLLSVTSASFRDGAMTMLVFGLGTLPGMVLAGYIGGQLDRGRQHQVIRLAAAVCVMILGVAMLFMAFQGGGLHAHH